MCAGVAHRPPACSQFLNGMACLIKQPQLVKDMKGLVCSACWPLVRAVFYAMGVRAGIAHSPPAVFSPSVR